MLKKIILIILIFLIIIIVLGIHNLIKNTPQIIKFTKLESKFKHAEIIEEQINQSPKTEKQKVNDTKGIKKEVIFLKNDQKQIKWYDNDTLIKEEKFYQEKLFLVILYNKLGKVEFLIYYKNGKKTKEQSFFANENIHWEIGYAEDGTESYKKIYKENGTKEMEISYENGKEKVMVYDDAEEPKDQEKIKKYLLEDIQEVQK